MHKRVQSMRLIVLMHFLLDEKSYLNISFAWDKSDRRQKGDGKPKYFNLKQKIGKLSLIVESLQFVIPTIRGVHVGHFQPPPH